MAGLGGGGSQRPAPPHDRVAYGRIARSAAGKNFSEEAIADGRVINWRWVVHPADEPIAGLFTVTRLVDDEVGAQVRERTVEIDIIVEGGLQIETGLGK